jgi:hypothetical protein
MSMSERTQFGISAVGNEHNSDSCAERMFGQDTRVPTCNQL